jgi:hypothetical protein
MRFSSVAANSFTPMDTSPKEIVPFQIDLIQTSLTPHATFERTF